MVVREARKVKMTRGMERSFDLTASGQRKMETKEVQAPVRKRANIHCEAVLRMWSTSWTSPGKGTGRYMLVCDSIDPSLRKVRNSLEAPANSSP